MINEWLLGTYTGNLVVLLHISGKKLKVDNQFTRAVLFGIIGFYVSKN